jgi:hypothetical protein
LSWSRPRTARSFGRVPFLAYATAWIDERPGLRPKTIQLYRYLLRVHLQDAFGSATVAAITEPDVRRWRVWHDGEGTDGEAP